MSRERFQKVDQLYQMACDLPVGERQAFLSHECAGDAELFQELQSLLAHDEAASSEFLEEPAFVSQDSPGGPAPIPERIGHYHLKRLIASGGMGTVYAAVQEHPRRAVAVKVMKHGIASRSALRRFEYESQVLARLRHPGIAQVYEAGTHDDGAGAVPFFAMEYIPNAKPITRYAVDAKLGTRERLALFIHVCDAVHHGHQKGVIHRDLKPGNVLVDTQGHVKIIDFGVARCTDSDMALTTLQTDVGQLIGTLQYMSPEQCEADPTDIDSRSDVYALGVMLYELLTEQLPYDVRQVAMHQATQVIREQHPAKPSTLNKTLRGDIETITLKALEKDRARRYQSASDLAQDIRRYLDGEAILARPASLGYQLQLFARRNKAVFAAIAAVFFVLVGASIVSFGLYVRAERARVEATAERVRAVAAERDVQDQLTNTKVARDESEAVTAFLIKMLASAHPNIAQGREVMVKDILDDAGQTVEKDFAEKPLVQAKIRATIGKTFMGLGLYAQAESHLRAAYDIRTQKLGDEHADTFQSRADLRELLWNQGNCAEAEKLVNFSLELRRQLLGEEHIETLRLRNHLSVMYVSRSDYAAAEKLRRETLAIGRRVLGDKDRFTLVCMNNLGLVLYEQGNYMEAEALLRETLEVRKQVPGENHPQTVRTMSNLALVLAEQGKYAEAERLHRKAVEMSRLVNGDEHPDTLGFMYYLSIFLAVQGKLDEARTYIVAVIPQQKEAAERSLADPRSLNDYAWLLLTSEPEDLRDPEAALPMAKKAVEISGGPVPDFLYTLALAYHITGHVDQAIETQKQALAALPDVETAYRTDLELTLISFFQAKGDHRAADSLLNKVVTRTGVTNGTEHIELVQRVTELALLLKASGKHQLCGSVCRALVNAVRLGGSPQGESGIAAALVALGSTLIQQERFEEADAILSKWLDIQQLGGYKWVKEHSEDPPDRLNEFIERVVKSYEFHEGANPGKGYAAKAAQWREKVQSATSTDPSSSDRQP